MGLTIARDIVAENGGRIDVLVDGRRRGASVRIRLPRRKSRATMPDR
jgi:C4-dicarboxylate-specific signal transduction histidine kinase